MPAPAPPSCMVFFLHTKQILTPTRHNTTLHTTTINRTEHTLLYPLRFQLLHCAPCTLLLLSFFCCSHFLYFARILFLIFFVCLCRSRRLRVENVFSTRRIKNSPGTESFFLHGNQRRIYFFSLSLSFTSGAPLSLQSS